MKPAAVVGLAVAVGIGAWAALLAGDPPERTGGTHFIRPPSAARDGAVTLETAGATVVIRDESTDVTVENGGRQLTIRDRRTGQEFRVDTQAFALLLGGQTNRIALQGDRFTLERDGRTVAEIRRKAVPTAAAPSSETPPTTSLPAATSPAIPTPLPRTSEPVVSDEPGEVRQFRGHTQRVTGVAFSPDGRLAASASWDGSLRLWDVATGQERRRLGDNLGQLGGVAFSPDGRYLGVLRGSDVTVWEVESGQQLSRFKSETHFPSSAGLAFLRDGSRVMTGGRGGLVRLWDVVDGDQVGTFKVPMEIITGVAVSADGRRALATGGYFNNSDTRLGPLLSVWDMETKEVLFELKPEVRTVLYGGVFTADGKSVVAEDIADRHQLARWDIASGRRMLVFPDNTSVRALAISPDGRHVLSGGSSGRVILSDVETGLVVRSFRGHDRGVNAVAFSADGRYAISGGDDNIVRLWRLPETAGETAPEAEPVLREVRQFRHDNYVYCVAFSPDGNRALSSGFDTTLRLWDISSGEELKKFKGDSAGFMLNDIAWLPDGRWALLGGGQSRQTGRLTLWDVESWSEARPLAERGSVIATVAVSHDGRHGLSGDTEGEVRRWELPSGRELGRYTPGTRDARTVAISPDGRRAVYAGGYEDFRVRVWEVESGHELSLLTGHTAQVNCAMFHPDDNTRVVSAGNDQTIRVWDLTTGRAISTLRASAPIACLDITSNGRYVLSGSRDGSVQKWNLESGKAEGAFRGHSERVTDIDVSPDGRHVLSASYDKTVRLLELPEERTSSN